MDKLIQKLRPYIPFTALNTIWRKLDKNSEIILDVGCGKGEPMKFINRHGKFKVVGIDIFKPYLLEAKETKVYKYLVLGNAVSLPFKNKSFDTVICMEVLEHLEKQDGERLLDELERVARRQILLSTPVGRYEQHSYDGNPYQKHRYIWQVSNLKRRGYKLKGMGIKGLPREEINSRVLRLVRELLYVLGSFFSYNLLGYRIACHIVAEKKNEKAKSFFRSVKKDSMDKKIFY